MTDRRMPLIERLQNRAKYFDPASDHFVGDDEVSSIGDCELLREAVNEIERLQAEVARLSNCHRIIVKQVSFYKPELPHFEKVEIYLGILRSAALCAGTAPWELEDVAGMQREA